MARSLARSQRSLRHANAPLSRRSLRVEHLEPRLVLSAALTLSPSADTYVNAAAPTANYGNAADLLVENSANHFTGSECDAYLKFNLTGISAPVTKAVLNLTPLAVSTGASSITIGIQLLKDSDDGWVEGSGGNNQSWTGPITWMNSPYGYGQIVTLSGSQLSASTPIAIDVTQLINQKFNVNGISSFVIGVISSPGAFGPSKPGAAWSVDFASRENPDVAFEPTLTVTTATTDPPPTVATQPSIVSQTSTTAALSVLGADTTDGESSLTYTWSVTSPAGAAAPTFSANGTHNSQNTTVTFHQAGTYVFTVKITDKTDGLSVTTNTVTVTMTQTLSGLVLSPSSVTVAIGSTQQFTASGVDQFGKTMAVGTVTWSASIGSIAAGSNTATATYTAPGSAVSDKVTATSGSFSATAAVTVVQSNYLGLLNPVLASLTQSLDADGSINRADMIRILDCVESESSGVVDAADFNDLKTILKDASTLNIVNYVLVLANDVVNGSPANAHYLGQPLGNLTAGSSDAKLEDLIDKWFYGTDLPATGGYSYDTGTAGTLYGASGPSHADEEQGDLGDCYLISALGSVADSSQAAAENMIIANGDGTWTVRFYSNGTADYVTVNSQLPVDSKGNLIFDGYGTSSTSGSNVLWLELLEKAYAQWNETGKAGRSGAANSYASIEGGWMGDVYAQTLNCADTTYQMTTSGKQTLISALSAGEAVTVGTDSHPAASTGLYGDHAYNVLSYDGTTGLFTLYNPWGIDQPAKLTWSQLAANCDGFAVGDTSAAGSASGARGSLIAPLILPSPIAMVSTSTTTPASSGQQSGAEGLGLSETQEPVRRGTSAADAVFAGYADSAGRLLPFAGVAMYRFLGERSAADLASVGDGSLTAEKLFSLDVDELLTAGLV